MTTSSTSTVVTITTKPQIQITNKTKSKNLLKTLSGETKINKKEKFYRKYERKLKCKKQNMKCERKRRQ